MGRLGYFCMTLVTVRTRKIWTVTGSDGRIKFLKIKACKSLMHYL